MKFCPQCDREFDHDPAECWACGVTTVDPDQASIGGFQDD